MANKPISEAYFVTFTINPPTGVDTIIVTTPLPDGSIKAVNVIQVASVKDLYAKLLGTDV